MATPTQTRTATAAALSGAGVVFAGLPPVIRARVYAERGMVSAAQPLAAEVGLSILRRGGNAVDAALATAATLTVVEPHMNHLGGDAFILVFDARTGQVTALNSAGPAPFQATLELYSAHGIPDRGPLSASVPGMVDGWFTAHERFATLPLTTLFEAAIDYAEHGFPVSPRLSQAMRDGQALLSQYPGSARQFLKNGEPYAPGERLVQPDTARTLKQLAEGGREAFYNGPVAEAIWRWSQREGALFSLRDFAEFQGEVLRPVTTTYRGYTIAETPPVSQGYLILQALNMLESFDLSALGPTHPQTMHLQIEALRLAMADRLAYAGDPRFVDDPVPTLISKEYARGRVQALNPERASASVLPGHIRGGDTTYFCIVDRQGNAVSWMQSLFASFGSGVVVPGTGVLLNNRLTGFSIDPNSPNCIAPGKRTMYTLNTYMVLQDRWPVVVGGSPGGMFQVQTNIQTISNMVDFGLDVQAAIEQPRWVWQGDVDVSVEDRVPPETIQGLAERGYRAAPIGAWAGAGRVQAIAIDRERRCLIGGADPRAECVAVGW